MRPMNNSYRPDIDGLRSVSIALVVLFHAFPDFCGGGYIGVDVFFVISGYLITRILLKDMQDNRVSYLDFYSRRFRRIVPALFVVLIFVWGLGWFVLLPDEYYNLGWHIAAGSTFSSNILLLFETGYFDTQSELKPLLHLWSLGVEEQYYIFWPLIIVLIAKHNLRKPVWIAGLLLASLVFMLCVHQATAFYLLPSRFWELLIGGWLADLEQERSGGLRRALRRALFNRIDKRAYEKAIPELTGIIGAVLLATATLVLTKTTPYPNMFALLPTVGAALLISAGPNAFLNRVILSNRFAVWIGLISYPLYLWHWPLLSYAEILSGETPPLWIRIALVGASIALAWLTWRFIERPVQSHLFARKPESERKKRLIGVASASLAATVTLGSLSIVTAGFPSRMTSNELFAQDLGQSQFARHLESLKVDRHLCAASGLDWHGWCASTPNKEIRFALWGDSHAEQLMPGLFGPDNHDGWVVLSHSACPPLLNVEIRQSDVEAHCVKFNENALEFLKNKPDITTVALSSLTTAYFTTRSAASKYGRDGVFTLLSTTYTGSPETIFQQGLHATIQTLIQLGKKVVILEDNPELPFEPRTCMYNRLARLVSSDAHACSFPRAQHELRSGVAQRIVKELQNTFPEIEVFHVQNVICDATECRIGSMMHSFYRDTDHLSAYGSKIVASRFLSWLAKQR